MYFFNYRHIKNLGWSTLKLWWPFIYFIFVFLSQLELTYDPVFWVQVSIIQTIQNLKKIVLYSWLQCSKISKSKTFKLPEVLVIFIIYPWKSKVRIVFVCRIHINRLFFEKIQIKRVSLYNNNNTTRKVTFPSLTSE